MARQFVARGSALLLVALLSLLPVARVLAAPPAQDAQDVVGTWKSEEYENKDGTFGITVSFFDDNSVEAVTEYEGNATPYVEVGTWESNDDGTVTLVVTGTPEQEYSKSTELVFELDGDELLAADFTAFSKDGLLLTKVDDKPVSMVDASSDVTETTTSDSGLESSTVDTTTVDATTVNSTTVDATIETPSAGEVDPAILDLPGLYVAGELDAGGATGGALLMLNEDGTAQGSALRFDGGESVPSSHIGEWVDNGDSSVTITMTQQIVASGVDTGTVEDLDSADPLDFDVVNGVLVSPLFNLYPVDEINYFWAPDTSALTGDTSSVSGDDAATAAGDAVAAEEAAAADAGSAVDTGAGGAGKMQMYMNGLSQVLDDNTIVLLLMGDGTASMSTQLGKNAKTLAELGTWEEDDSGVVTVTLTQDAEGNEYDEPYVLEFERDADGNLAGTDYDTDRYGEDLILEVSTH